jgi:perosamine synthetase
VHIIRLAPPRISERQVTFSWAVEPATPLYRQHHFSLQFPESVDIGRVPLWLWWRIALVCLHPHWAWIRPCRVVLPVRLEPGERELWLRLLDAEVWALEADTDGDTSRRIEIVEAGPLLPPIRSAGDGVVAAFSGGRDSLTQTALLQEMGERPLLVATTSPRENSVEHETPRRRFVMNEIVRRRGVELVEVTSDFRGIFHNGFLAHLYGRSVSEVTDTFLFFAAALAVAATRGARAVFLASEADVQETVRRGGLILQHRHFMYSAVTQRALSAVMAPTGIQYSGLTSPLLQFQVQRLLERRFKDIRDLQYSCWELTNDQKACSRCRECFVNAINVLAEGVSPSELGIDLATLVQAQRRWKPGGTPERPRGRVGQPAARYGDQQIVRSLRAIGRERFTSFLASNGDNAEPLAAFDELRAMAFQAADPEPEPGYRAGYLAFVDEYVRNRLKPILDAQFARADPQSYADLLQRSTMLADWITAPLRRGERSERRAPAIVRTRSIPRPPIPPPPAAADLARIADCIPGPEPDLVTPPGGRVLPVAETLLDGNELRYVTECIEMNWVSSTGTFVRRFESAFAAAAGCDFGIATSSGTAALHLMLVAAGIGPGDEVIVPTFTMIATANTVALAGARPIFVDADPATWNLDPERVRQRIGPRTRAIVAVHTYGHPVDIGALSALAHANGVLLLEDAAEAAGATYHGRPAGSLGAAAAFSMYGNKIITTGEGGMITTNDPELAAVARELRDHGFSPERHFWHRHRAFNYRLSNLQAAVGLAQVERLDALVAARRRTAALYRKHLSDIPGLTLPPVQEGVESACWMFGILIGNTFGCSRDELRQRLAAEGIETRTFFVPLHLQPAYLADNAGCRHPVAEHLGRTGLYLPSGPRVTEADVERVAAAIRRANAIPVAQTVACRPSSA